MENYLHLDFDGRELMFTIKKETTFFSKHTGIALKKIEVSLRVDRKIHEDITKIIKPLNKTEINSIGEQGKILKKWKIENSTYSCIENKYNHYLKLTEIEDFHVDSLIVDELTLYPYSYNEKFIRDALTIKAKVKLSELQFAEIKKLIERHDYFKVVRHGISDEPREMKLGVPLWSKHKDIIKYEIILSDKKYFETKKKILFFSPSLLQRISNMSFLLAKQDEILKEVLTVLSNKKVLTNDEITEIKEKASTQSRIREIDFYQAKDIDELL